MTKAKPTLEDGHRLAAVSRATSPRAVNDAPGASEELRARVRHAVTALGYQPNEIARALASGRQRSIDVIAINDGTDTAWIRIHPYYSRVLAGIMSELETANLQLR